MSATVRLYWRVRVHQQRLHLPEMCNHDASRVSVTRRVCGYLGSRMHVRLTLVSRKKLSAALNIGKWADRLIFTLR